MQFDSQAATGPNLFLFQSFFPFFFFFFFFAFFLYWCALLKKKALLSQDSEIAESNS
jgi:hypothetical protein